MERAVADPWLLTRFVAWVAELPLWSVLALLAALVLLILVVIVLLLRRGRGEAKPKAPRRKERPPREPAGMMRAAKSFHGRLRAQFSGSRAIYRLPLFVVVGPSRDANSAVVQRSGLRQPLGRPLDSAGLRWSAFDRAATLEVEPRMILGPEGRGERWKQCLRMLERLRPQRPVDGVVVVLPAWRLAGPDALDADTLRAEAEELRDALAALQNRLGMTTPVHLFLAQAEALPGFDELTRVLPPDRLDHPVGMTFRGGANDVYRPDHVDEAIDHLVSRTEALVAEGLSAGSSVADRDSFFLLPAALQELAEPLGLYLDTLFRPGHYARLASLRGIYLAGASYSVGSDVDTAFAGGALSARVFPEYALAQPANTSWVSQNRDVRRLQAATAAAAVVAVAALIAGDRVLSNRVPQVESLTSAVAQDFRRIQLARADGDDGGALLQENSVEFLRRMASLEGGYLRSVLLPSSWLAQVPRDVQRLQAAAYVEILFKSIAASLRSRAQAVTAPAESTRPLAGDGIGRSVEAALQQPYPDYSRLAAMVSGYGELARQLAHYDRLRQGHRDSFALRELVDYLYGLEFPEDFFPDIRHDTLAGRRGGLLEPLRLADFEAQARASFLRRYELFLEDLVARDNLAGRLDSVAGLLSGRRLGRAAEEGQLARLRGLYRDLSDLRALLDDGRYDWVADRGAPLDEDFRRLTVRVREQPLLGARAADRMAEMAVQHRARFRERLTGISADGLGALVTAADGRLTLSPAAEGVLEQLAHLEPLTSDRGRLIARASAGSANAADGGVEGAAGLPAPPSFGRYVHWRVDVLERGWRMLEDFESRLPEGAAIPVVRRILDDVVRQEKVDAIAATVRRAMAERPEHNPVAGSGDEAALEERVANFRAARAILDDFLFRLEDLGAGRERRALIRLVGAEAEKILAAADQLLAASEPYALDRARLESWDGSRGLAGTLFGVRGPEGLASYLGEQRIRAERLHDGFAAPALSFLYREGASYRPRDIDTLLRWQVLQEDLRAYRNGKPGNPIARLEDYILERLPRVAAGRCGLAEPDTLPRGDTFHEVRLREIARAVLNACRAVETRDARQAYSDLAERFNRDLAGRAPFVAAEEAHRADPASAETVIRFIQAFDRAMNRGAGDPRYWPETGPLARVPDFLDKLDRAVGVLRPAIDESGGQPTLAYEVSPTFRVNRDREIDGESIIGWSLSTGAGERTLFDSGRPLRWEVGQPARVSLRWARNAISAPDSADIAGYSVSGRTASFAYDGPWSLFALIAQRGERRSPAQGHLLSFDVPVSYGAAEDDSGRIQGGHARVFINLRLRADGEAVALPPFPARAPAFGDRALAPDTAQLAGEEPAR